VTDAARLDLLRPRNIGGLFRDAFNAYFRNLGAWLAIGATIVLPVELVVSGIGLGQLNDHYTTTVTPAEGIVTSIAAYLVIGPLVTAMVIHGLLALADGGRPRPLECIMTGLEAFRPMFIPVLIAGALSVCGLLLFILPGIWLIIRLYFTPQAVVVDGRRGMGALERSAELVRGAWWRVAGIVLFTGIAVFVPTRLVLFAFDAAGKAADSQGIVLAGQAVAGALAAPFAALMLTLLYFDLLARHSLPAMVPPVQPPQ
jgi:hypothetical protein